MSLLHNNASSSPSPSQPESLAYYKTQYEQLEAELADFQASSKELEAELEKDVEAAERRERQLQEKVEALGFEVEEWKTKSKQSKSEANAAQNTLQKEITTLRDTNRTIHNKLRDIEVSNDNFERQARNTTSSLEDLESKYNQSIERGVMAEEEIKAGEQEREGLRIETQRLRDELNDLKIEAEIRQDKLRHAEAAAVRQQRKKPPPLAPQLTRPESATSDISPTTSTSSPTIATPPTKSASSTMSETPTPPSPPTSDKSTSQATIPTLPVAKSRPSLADSNLTPRPLHSSRAPRHSRGPSIPISSDRTPSLARRTTLSRPENNSRSKGLPASGSLHHLHGLMNKMQMLEQRVHSVRSKLPAPTSTPPRASPRGGSTLGQSSIPATVTMRSNKKRTGGSNASSVHTPVVERPASRLSSTFTPGVDRPASRLSFGFAQPSPSREPNPDRPLTRDGQSSRPPTRDGQSSRPPSRDPHQSRPGSRASLTSRQSISHLPSATTSSSSRPTSRQSVTGSRTPLGHYATVSQSETRRPRSSIGGSFTATHGHSQSASVNRLSNYGSHYQPQDDEETNEVLTPTPSRRTTTGKGDEVANTPGYSLSTAASRKSGAGTGRRVSSGTIGGMGPPERRGTRKLSGVGETF